MNDSVRWIDYFNYDADTGILSHRVKRGSRTAIGQEVGSIKHDGRYRSFVLLNQRYYTHRVVWEMLNGPIPPGMCIDHIDGNGLNNRLSNLRLTTLSGNQRNKRLQKNNRTGMPGVFHRKNGFEVRCGSKYIGYFGNLNDAIAARKTAEIQHNYHPNNGRRQNANS